MAQCKQRNANLESNCTPTLKSHDGILDFWDGVITQEKGSENKVKWKKRYLELQASLGSYVYLLIYKPTHKKKKTKVPLMKFTLTDETSSIFVGPIIKNKYTFDIGVRIGKLFMRYRFGLETEELRNKWIYEIVNSFYANPFTSESLTYLVTPMSTPEVVKLRLNTPSYLLLYKDHIELCSLANHARLGKWQISAVHSYITDKNVFTIKFKPNSMYGDIEIPFHSDSTVDLFRILNSLITRGEFPQTQIVAIKRNHRALKKIPVNISHPLPDMKQNGDRTISPYASPILQGNNWPNKQENRVKKTISNPADNHRIIHPVNYFDPFIPQFNTTPHPHSPERKGSPFKANRIKTTNSCDFDDYDTLVHFQNQKTKTKNKFPLGRTDGVIAFSDLIQASHSTGNIPTMYSALSPTHIRAQNSPYSADQTYLQESFRLRSNSDQNLFEKAENILHKPIPFAKTSSLHDILSDDLNGELLNPYDVIPDRPILAKKLVQTPAVPKIAKRLPPPLPSPRLRDYESITLPERGTKSKGMKKSPSTENHIGYGNFLLEENRQWGSDTNQKNKSTSPKHYALEEITEQY